MASNGFAQHLSSAMSFPQQKTGHSATATSILNTSPRPALTLHLVAEEGPGERRRRRDTEAKRMVVEVILVVVFSLLSLWLASFLLAVSFVFSVELFVFVICSSALCYNCERDSPIMKTPFVSLSSPSSLSLLSFPARVSSPPDHTCRMGGTGKR